MKLDKNTASAGKELPVPRVLIVVSGGIADYVADEGVAVEIFDFDNYKADPENTDKVPAHFRDMAEMADVPFEED